MKTDRIAELVQLWHQDHKKWRLRAIADGVLGEGEGFNKKYQTHIILRLLQGDRVTQEFQIESLLHLSQWKAGSLKIPKHQERNRSRWHIKFPHFVLVGKGSKPKSILHLSWAKRFLK